MQSEGYRGKEMIFQQVTSILGALRILAKVTKWVYWRAKKKPQKVIQVMLIRDYVWPWNSWEEVWHWCSRREEILNRLLNRKMNDLFKGFDPEYQRWERLKPGKPVRMFQKFRWTILRTWTRFTPKGKEETWKHFQKLLIAVSDQLISYKKKGEGSFKCF